MKKLFVITGEYSGDIHASKVVAALKSKYSDLVVEGIGGENLKSAGVKLFSDQKKMGAVGLSPKIVIDHFTLGKRVVDYITKEFKPDLVLLIDYGVFNLNVSKFLKKAGIKVFYYIPPQVWASRKWRINTIKKNVDEVLCIFPFEKEMYESYGIKTHYCGHPLVSQLPEKADKDDFFEKHGLDKNKKLVSIFPGSRTFELQNLMDVFLGAAKILKEKENNVQFVISQAPSIKDETFEKYFKNSDIPVIKNDNHALLSVSDALILASGTVALEAALYQTPMIISYRGPWFYYLVYRLVRCINRVCLPNIILDKDVVPEILQGDCKAEIIAENIHKLLTDEAERTAMIEDLGHVKSLLSKHQAAKEAANIIISALK